MANSVPARLGQINSTGNTEVGFWDIFAGEVLTAYEKAVVAASRTQTRTITHGKSATWPTMGRATAAYHTPGAQLLGSPINQAQTTIVIDDLLVAHVVVDILDFHKAEYDVTAPFSTELGLALAYAMDQNLLQTGVLAARATNPTTGLPGGTSLVDANFRTDAKKLAAGLFLAAQTLDENSVPETDRTAFIRPAQYYLLAQNTDAINTLFGGKGAYSDGTIIRIAGIDLVKSLHLPITNITTGPTKYRVNAAQTAGLVLHRGAIGTLKLLDLSLEHAWLPEKQATLIVARYAVGHGILRPEGAVELKLPEPSGS